MSESEGPSCSVLHLHQLMRIYCEGIVVQSMSRASKGVCLLHMACFAMGCVATWPYASYPVNRRRINETSGRALKFRTRCGKRRLLELPGGKDSRREEQSSSLRLLTSGLPRPDLSWNLTEFLRFFLLFGGIFHFSLFFLFQPNFCFCFHTVLARLQPLKMTKLSISDVDLANKRVLMR